MRKTEVMTKLKRNQTGITLIALVITIIVLLILAGVAISMLSGENGILKQAANAKTQTEKASTDEEVKLAALAGLTAGHGKMNFDVLNDELTEVAGKEIKIEKLPATVIIDGNDYTITSDGRTREATGVEKNIGKEITVNKATLLDENNEQIVVPVGFTIKADSPTTVKRGIVVVAPDNSEFVWVPVTDINSMVMCQSHTGTSDCNIIKGADGELTCENHTDTLICGKLYATSIENNFNSELTTQTYSATSGLRESAYLKNTSSGDATTTASKGLNLLSSIVGISGTVGTDDATMLSTWETQLQDEFEEMAKSVYNNKGFYIGRYETSLNTTTNYAQSISGETSATAASSSANTWYGLYQKEKEYSANNSLTEKVGSSMIWGSQYDQMMIWMQNNGIDVTSTTPINLEGITTSKNTGTGSAVGTTGTVETDKLNNIYDLLGNGREWTLEANHTNNRVYRGGNYRVSDSPSYRNNDNPYLTHNTNSSRLVLYVM